MKYVYLINKLDNWCPENNNGDYIIEVYSTLELATAAVENLYASQRGGRTGDWEYSIQRFPLDVSWEQRLGQEHEDL